MKASDKREVIIVASTTAIGFIGNVVTYSLKLPTQSKHGIKDFKFVIPKGVELIYVLGIGFVAGLIINKGLEYIENNFKTPEEKLLANKIREEEEKIKQGLVKNRVPVITWV